MLTDRVLHELMGIYHTYAISNILDTRPEIMHRIANITRLQPTDLIDHIDKYVAEVCTESGKERPVSGREEGKWENLITLVCRKLMKGENIAAISDALEEDPETISMITHVVEKHPDNMMDHIDEYVEEVLKIVKGA